MKPAVVAKTRCSTCIFGTNSPVDAERTRDLRAAWSKGDNHQVCHHFGVGTPDKLEEGSRDVWCRGFYETQVPPEVRELMEGALAAAGIVTFIEQPEELEQLV